MTSVSQESVAAARTPSAEHIAVPPRRTIRRGGE